MLNVNDLPSKDRQLFSLGYTCQLLQVVPGQLRVLMESTGVKPFWTVDDVAYFDGDGVQELVNAVNAIRKEITDAAETLRNASEQN
jgi:hypothetical protein